MYKPDGLSRCSGEEQSGMDAKLFQEGQLFDREDDENDNSYNADDIELEGTDLSKWAKRNGLWLVPEEHRLEVLQQHHDSQVAAQWGRHRTQELFSRNFA